MAKDHFGIRSFMEGKVDWNFNILFNDQPQIGELATEYAKLLNYPGLYPPVPPEWLHITVLRIGFTTDFTDAEILAVTALLEKPLAAINMPLCTLDPVCLYKGYPLLSPTPVEPFDQVFQEVLNALKSVIGQERMPNPIDRSLAKFEPHMTLAYTRDYDTEAELQKLLTNNPLPPVNFKPSHLSLVKQKAINHRYEWEVIKELLLG
jgi:2'-5' RNA ligase